MTALHTEARDAAIAAAQEAWRQINELYEVGSHITEGPEGPSTEADKLADKILTSELRKTFSEDQGFAYLTEETEDDRRRLDTERVWIIDPIDGTKDFIQKNGAFAMHIGMVERQANGLWEPVVGVVYRPVPGQMFSAIKGEGARLQPCKDNKLTGDARKLQVSNRQPVSEMKIVVSNSHRSSSLLDLVEFIGFADKLHIGSIGIKLGLVATGEYDVYINLARGKTREWDYCAPDLILTEAGGVLTGVEGSPILYNQEDPHDLEALLGTNGRAHQEISEKIREFESQQG